MAARHAVITIWLIAFLTVALSFSAPLPEVAQPTGVSSSEQAAALDPVLQKTLRAYLPERPPQGWKLEGEPSYFDLSSLTQRLGPAAEDYQNYGCRMALSAKYVPPGGKESVQVQIFAMGDALGAFGIYSTERFPDLRIVKIGQQGFVDRDQLCFWKGSCYAKLTCEQPVPAPPKVAFELAQEVAKRMPDGEAQPGPLKYLPTRARVPNSEHYFRSRAMGLPFLTNAVTASYSRGKRKGEFNLVIVETDDAQQAGKTYAAWERYQLRSSSALVNVFDLGEQGYAAQDRTGMGLIVIRQGRFVAAIIGPMKEDLPIFRGLLNTLARAPQPGRARQTTPR